MSAVSLGEPAGAPPELPPLGLADYALALAAGAAALLLYARTLAPGLLGGDSGEFQFAAYLGGFAHPTGYPLYLLLGYLWTHLLPVGGPAYRMNLFSALWGGVAVGLTYLLAAQMIRLAAPPAAPRRVARLSALFAACLFAVTPTFWSQAVVAEVYTLHAALLAAILLGLVTWKARESAPGRYRLLYVSAFLFGLGLTHHRSTLLLLPAILLFVLQSRKWSGSWRRRFAGSARALPLMLAPVVLYALIPLRAPRLPYADVVVSPDQIIQLYRPTVAWFLQHVTGSGFSSALHTPVEAMAGAGRSLRWLVEELTLAGALLAALGVAWLFRRTRPLLTLTGVAFLTFAAFNLFYGIGDIRVFYIPIFLIASLWAGVGVSAVASVILTSKAGAPVRGLLAGTMCLLVFALPAALLMRHAPALDRSGDRTAETFWRSLLAQPIPAGAILVSNDRDEMTPLWYLQYVENLRPDISGLFPLIDSGPQWENVGQVIDASRNSGRPLYLIKAMPGLSVKLRMTPEDGLVRVDGPAVTRPPENARAIAFDDVVRLAGYDLQPGLANPGKSVAVALHWQPLRQIPADLTTFVHVLNGDGAVVGQSDHKPGGDYYPTGLWRPGELLRDVHTLTLAPDLGPPPYALEVGLYRLGSQLTHLGAPQRIGFIGRARPSDAVPADLIGSPGFVLDDQIALAASRITPGKDRLNLNLYWQALRTPDHDYTVFAHVIDETGTIVAQQDQQPTAGETPTSTWPAGQIVADTVTISLPTNLESQTYRVIVGMYDALTGQRLPIASEDGGQVGDAIPLGEFAWPPGS
jgi:hypothetical protein